MLYFPQTPKNFLLYCASFLQEERKQGGLIFIRPIQNWHHYRTFTDLSGDSDANALHGSTYLTLKINICIAYMSIHSHGVMAPSRYWYWIYKVFLYFVSCWVYGTYIWFFQILNPTTISLESVDFIFTFSFCGTNCEIICNLNYSLYDSLIIVFQASTLARSFIMLHSMEENKNKSYPIILISLLRS